MRGIACAKVNLGLQVSGTRPDGLHDLTGLFQSIAWTDRLRLVTGVDEDSMAAFDPGRPVPEGDENLAWRAAAAVRQVAASPRPMSLELDKRIPVAAGLGGGSADAALSLVMAAWAFDVPMDDVTPLAPMLGSDVSFCLLGGTAVVSGGGEAVAALPDAAGFALAVVVPPIELSTAAVYARWDSLGGPQAAGVGGADLPPSLRDLAPLRNDLYGAAVAEAPAVDEWRSELAGRFDRTVLMSGSGPALFAFFVDVDEAADAIRRLPAGARDAWAGEPVPFGWAVRRREGDPIAAGSGTTWTEEQETRWWPGTFDT
ncbi:MAG TPA: 4-(cytidine 5'-diphospho)-2-C-methyl-D-erythritol kinase [Acidimicrobiia bacterium]|jgi:4-diphosphocytidyl-2-C-methyl-D-erythritol kinase